MKNFLNLSICILLLSIPCFAKSWNSIFPLQTTRAAVLDLLGEPKQNSIGEEFFEFENQTISFKWLRADCYGRDSILDEKSVKADSLVYQITVEPENPLNSIEIYNQDVSSEPTKQSNEQIYKDWISESVSCLSSKEYLSCTISNSQKGFGYRRSEKIYSILYFFPTQDEITDRKQKLSRCSEDGGEEGIFFH